MLLKHNLMRNAKETDKILVQLLSEGDLNKITKEEKQLVIQ